jgi:acyl-CoA thioester hydrolase
LRPPIINYQLSIINYQLSIFNMVPVYEHKVLVLPSDIDENRHANNLCYLRWMNEAALAHSSVNGWPTRRYIELGASWFARRHTIEYLVPAAEGDQLTVQTWIYNWKAIRSVRKYRFLRQLDGAVMAEAETLWAFVNLATGKPTKIPSIVADSFVVVEELQPACETKNCS